MIPDHIRKRFVQVGHRYHFPDGAHAFTDRGARLVTPSENTEVVKSLIAIADARGWKEITVTGTERFRKEAWAAGSALGLKVRGYTPTEFERAHLARKLAREAATHPELSSRLQPLIARARRIIRGLIVPRDLSQGGSSITGLPPIATIRTSQSLISSKSKPRTESARSGAWT